MTPEEIGKHIAWHEVMWIGKGADDRPDWDALADTIATAIRDAYERAAQVCDAFAEERQQQMDDVRNQHIYNYFRDMQAAYQYAARDIRALKGETQ